MMYRIVVKGDPPANGPHQVCRNDGSIVGTATTIHEADLFVRELNHLFERTTKQSSVGDLVNELTTRDKVMRFRAGPSQRVSVEVLSGVTENRPEISVAGPSRVLVVID